MSMKIRSVIQASLTLMVLAACTPQNNLSLAPMPAPNSPFQAAPQPQNQTAVSSAALASSVLSSRSGAALQSELTLVHEDEAIYQDTLTVAAESGFQIQQVNEERDEALADERSRPEHMGQHPSRPGQGMMRPPMPGHPGMMPGHPGMMMHLPRPHHPAQLMPPAQARQMQDRVQAHVKAQQAAPGLQQAMQQLIRALQQSGAVEMQADGRMILDPRAFQGHIQQGMSQHRAQFEKHLQAARPKLERTRELGQDQQAKLKRQNNLVRTSDRERIQNADGSITEILKVEFDNSRAGIKRQTYLAKTKLGDQMLKLEYKLEETTPAFERSASRLVTHHEDGSKTILLESKTTWKNGRIRTHNEERRVQADGSATGTGTLTLTSPDGSVKTHEFTVTITARGQMTSSSSDTESNTTVTVDEAEDGSATVIVEENGETEAVEVDLETEAEAAATTEDEAEADEADDTETAAEETDDTEADETVS